MTWFRRKSQVWETSGNLSADAVVSAVPCIFVRLILVGDGVNAASAILYDNADGDRGPDGVYTGQKIIRARTRTTAVVDGLIQTTTGLLIYITGTGANAVVLFR